MNVKAQKIMDTKEEIVEISTNIMEIEEENNLFAIIAPNTIKTDKTTDINDKAELNISTNITKPEAEELEEENNLFASIAHNAITKTINITSIGAKFGLNIVTGLAEIGAESAKDLVVKNSKIVNKTGTNALDLVTDEFTKATDKLFGEKGIFGGKKNNL